MSFKKLALVSAMFAATSGAFAMEALDEEAMAATTGQDGITIGLSTQMAVDMIIHDKNGFLGAADSGAIVIRGFGLSDGAGGNATIGIDIDAGQDVTAPTLNIGVTLGDGLGTGVTADLGTLRVANSNRTLASVSGADYGVTTESGVLLDLGQVTIADGATINIQLGREVQGHLIVLDAVLAGGLSLSGVALNDTFGGPALGGGSIGVSNLIVRDAGGADLTTNIGVDATAAGLVVSLTQVGHVTNGMAVLMEGVNLGSAASIGDVEIVGLNMNGDTITISGH